MIQLPYTCSCTTESHRAKSTFINAVDVVDVFTAWKISLLFVWNFVIVSCS